MDSLIWTGPILAGKRVALRKYGVAVTRRLDGLKEINQEPDIWYWWPDTEADKATGKFVFHSDKSDKVLFIKPRYHVGQVVFVREAYSVQAGDFVLFKIDCETDVFRDSIKWHSPYAMSEKLARQFVQITSVRPERVDLAKISQHEIELEGGEVALKILKKYDGLWVFRDEFIES